jgi:hypothetical protein
MVSPRVWPGPGLPDLHLDAAQVHRELARHLRLWRVTATDHHGRPGQARHAVGIAEQAREALHLALHVLRAALVDQVQRALAGDDFGGAFGEVGAGAQHPHRVVVGQQHVLDGLVADGADAAIRSRAMAGVAVASLTMMNLSPMITPEFGSPSAV